MSSPAERYARVREKSGAGSARLEAFAARLDFPLDDFQIRAMSALDEGRGVLVAAPTGAGKTVVGEFAVHLALATGRKAFYTTPIKALSNQKYADLARVHGSSSVGLLTGDSSINSEAPVVVMTTEVLRNMMYAESSTLDGLGFVVMDEVHYLADRFRGAVWEEVIIHLPQDVLVVSLSATVSNAEEFGAWLGEVRGATEVVVEEHRPVPLWQHMLVGRDLLDLFIDRVPEPGADGRLAADHVNPELIEAIRARRGPGRGGFQPGVRGSRRGRLEDAGAPRGRRGKTRRGSWSGEPDDLTSNRRPHSGRSAALGRGGASGARSTVPSGRGSGASPGDPRSRPCRAEVIALLDDAGLLPAITFIFSRAGCDAAVQQLLAWGIRLIDDEQADRIARFVESRVTGLAVEDLSVLGYWDFLEGLTRGFAAHHAGMLPTFREIVEQLFTAGEITCVFATETLALGINMPARTVILEKLVKFNGETHADITPAEYTQLTGRAGRRGIDIEGHAVVLWHPSLDPLAVAGLASTRTYPLRSSFRPTYNMAVNLVERFSRERAAAILETSFAQFQADRAVVGLVRQIREHDEALAGYARSMECSRGDFTEYAALREQLSALEKGAVKDRAALRRELIRNSLDALSVGDVVAVPHGRHTMRAVVVTTSRNGRGNGPQAGRGPGRAASSEVGVVTEDARQRRLVAADLDDPVLRLGTIRLPKQLNLRVATQRRDLASTMRAQVPASLPPDGMEEAGGTGSSTTGSSAARPGEVEERISGLRQQLRAHPCHACPDRERHARWAERYHRLSRETRRLRRKVEGRTNSVARTFDRICDLLVRLGYLAHDGRVVTPDGRRLARLYTERDLLTAQCLRHGVWASLDPPSLAAVISCLIHEPRREDTGVPPRMPNDAVIDAHDATVRLWSDLEDLEAEHHVTPTSYPDPGLAWPVHRWASGQRLEIVLRDTDLAAGDFVRRCKQVVDLLDQIAEVAPQPALQASARAAVQAVMRGVVAADRID